MGEKNIIKINKVVKYLMSYLFLCIILMFVYRLILEVEKQSAQLIVYKSCKKRKNVTEEN